jgi:large subunit ribosomal protein L30
MPEKKDAQTRSRAAAQKKSAAKAGAKLRVKQSRSTSGRPYTHRRTLIALGLRYHQQVIEINDSPAIRGMLHQVRHLVEVTPAGEK